MDSNRANWKWCSASQQKHEARKQSGERRKDKGEAKRFDRVLTVGLKSL